MTTPIGHSLFGLIVYFSMAISERKRSLALLALFLIAVMIPDFDYFPMLWGDLELANLNHQGFTHSLFFAVLIAIALAVIGAKIARISALRLYPFVLIALLSHYLLDFLTYDGREPFGIPLLWPFSDARFNSPLTVFGGFAKGSFSDFVSLHNFRIVAGEILILGIPALLLWWLSERIILRKSTGSGSQ
jgi:inner membrane protein